MDANLRKIEQRFNNSQNALVLQQSDLSLQSISMMVMTGAIDISPKYQRRERWDANKESELIESFLLNIPVPPIYLAEDEYGTYSVIDGKQRVTAINKFLNDDLRLNNLEKFRELEGYSFSQLPAPLSNALSIRPYLRVVTLLRQSDPDLKHEVFLRLNKAGVALNSQEIRNVAFRGPFNDLLFELSSNDYFCDQIKSDKSSKIYREMTDVQYVLRFFTVRALWDHFPGNMDFAMDMFMRENYRNSAAVLKEQKQIFNAAIEFCKEVWGDQGFVNPNSNMRVIQGIFDVQMVCSSLLSKSQRAKALLNKKNVREMLKDYLNNDEIFLESVTQFTQNSKNVYYRIMKFTEGLKNL